MSITPIVGEGAFTQDIKTLVNNGLGDVPLCSASTSIVSSTTLTDVTGMTTNLSIGTYTFSAALYTTANASAGLKVGFNYSSGLTLSAIQAVGYGFTASSTVSPNVVSSTTAQTAIISSTSAVTLALIEGTLTVSAPGTLSIQAAQNASSASSTVVSSLSKAFFRKIA